MMERCKNISPFVSLMLKDVKRCLKMCGNTRRSARSVPLPPTASTGQPQALMKSRYWTVMLIPFPQVLIRQIKVCFFGHGNAGMPQESAQCVNVHTIHKTAFGEIIS